MRVVTTYPPGDWDKYVARNIASWVKYVDAEIVVYTEEEREIDGCTVIPLGRCPGLNEILYGMERFPPAHGMFGEKYDYNYDAFKFCRKVFAQYEAAVGHSGVLLWLDADVEALQPVSEGVISALLGDYDIGLYQREGYHSECGIVAWNCPQAMKFFNLYRNLYTTGQIFRFSRGWHDCWATDLTIEHANILATNFSPILSEGLAVVESSVLGPYFRHDKGNRKYQAA